MGLCGHERVTAPFWFFFLLKSAKEEPGLEASQPCWLQASLMLHASMQAVLQQEVLLAKVSKSRACAYHPTRQMQECAFPSPPEVPSLVPLWRLVRKGTLFKDF